MNPNRKTNGQYDFSEKCTCCNKPMTDEFFGIENPNIDFFDFVKRNFKETNLLAVCGNCGDMLQYAQEVFLEYPKKFHSKKIEFELVERKDHLRQLYIEAVVKSGYYLPDFVEVSERVAEDIESHVFGGYKLKKSWLSKVKISIVDMLEFLNFEFESFTIFYFQQ